MPVTPQTSFGMALLPAPVAWEPCDRAPSGHRASQRARDEALGRDFPAGWSRDTVPDWPVPPPARRRRRVSEYRAALACGWPALYQSAALALKRIPAASLANEVACSPSSRYGSTTAARTGVEVNHDRSGKP
jgi:hypothetical protein